MRVQVVPEQDGVSPAQPVGHTIKPALGGVDLAVLLLRAVLRRDKLRAQGHGLPDARRDDHGRDSLVAEDRPPVLVAGDQAARARDLLRAVEVRPVEGDQRATPEDAVTLHRAALLQDSQEVLERAVKQLSRRGVQQVPDVVVRRDGPDAEECQGVAFPLLVLHGPLAGEPRRGLEEEHGERGHHRVRDGVVGVLPLPFVREIISSFLDKPDAPSVRCRGSAARLTHGRPPLVFHGAAADSGR